MSNIQSSADSLNLRGLKLEPLNEGNFEFDKELQDLLAAAYGLKQSQASLAMSTCNTPTPITTSDPSSYWYHTPTPSPTFASQKEQPEQFAWPTPPSDCTADFGSPFETILTHASTMPSAIDPSFFAIKTDHDLHFPYSSSRLARSPSPACFSEDGSQIPLTPPPSPFHSEFRRVLSPLDIDTTLDADYPSSPISTTSTISSPYPATPVTPGLSSLPFSSSLESSPLIGSDGKKQKKRVWYCKLPGCTKTYGTGAGLRWHLKHFHKQQSKRAVNKKPLAFRCDECDKAYSTMAGLRYHRKTVAHMEVVSGTVSMLPAGLTSGLALAAA
ncbi:hypothetical protein HK097_001679 [Rhizophlyctis rosea]|uniref:C2H2-type domain-containing protein n=1 Tax=Rhizophlyctis rosea TaxID=64517 RepID=A0AAD5X7D3_9FUNG|nr:hypothetical protein HK097_001679 [Rhizophlyctis rosea]